MASDKKTEKKQDIRWAAVLWYIHLHILGLYGLWLTFTSAKWMTVFFTLFITALGAIGVTAGSHRLWAHRSFEASPLLKLFLVLAHTLAGVGSIYDWVLYHRMHHKYLGTDKDPYNHKKGFLYSHYVGNIQSPIVDYEQAQKDVDIRDMETDPLVWIQRKFYWIMFVVFGLLLPLNAPLEYWDESLTNIVLITGILRFAITVNVAWMVNSGLLIWGSANKLISIFATVRLLYRLLFAMPKSHGSVMINQDGIRETAESSISVFIINKSNWPYYHYMVPSDWKTGEFGDYGTGYTTSFLKLCQELGFAYKMRTISTEDVREFLNQLATKKITLEEGRDCLKEMAAYNARKSQLELQK